jgi:hypothetical protein
LGSILLRRRRGRGGVLCRGRIIWRGVTNRLSILRRRCGRSGVLCRGRIIWRGVTTRLSILRRRSGRSGVLCRGRIIWSGVTTRWCAIAGTDFLMFQWHRDVVHLRRGFDESASQPLGDVPFDMAVDEPNS